MNLEDKYNSQGSVLKSATTKYDGKSNLEPINVFDSSLDKNGVIRRMNLAGKQTTQGLAFSQLDLDGQTPNKYLDNKPE